MHEPDPADLGTAFGMEASLEGDDQYRQVNAEAYELESKRARAALESPLAWLSHKRPG